MKRKEKYIALIDACISKMDADERAVNREIAEYAVDLGYTPLFIPMDERLSAAEANLKHYRQSERNTSTK
jgi:hypothetical protein